MATTADIILKKTIVAFQAGGVPSVHSKVPILAAAERFCTGWEWCAKSGDEIRRKGAPRTTFFRSFTNS